MENKMENNLVAAVIAHAEKNYTAGYGWQVIVECMEATDVARLIVRDAQTVRRAINNAREFAAIHQERHDDAVNEVF